MDSSGSTESGLDVETLRAHQPANYAMYSDGDYVVVAHKPTQEIVARIHCSGSHVRTTSTRHLFRFLLQTRLKQKIAQRKTE